MKRLLAIGLAALVSATWAADESKSIPLRTPDHAGVPRRTCQRINELARVGGWSSDAARD
jgi:hypothetical protein